MMGTKLNAQVIIKNLQNMHEKSLPPTGARRRMELGYQDWARKGKGDWSLAHTGGRYDRQMGRRMRQRLWTDCVYGRHDPPVDSTSS